jgi:hypothetical protein
MTCPPSLFSTTFWHVLPTQHSAICTRISHVARLHYEACAALLPSDRAASVDSLKAELEMLEHDVGEYRRIVRSIDVADIVQIYVVAGRQRWCAEQIAKEDLGGLEGSLGEVEERVRGVRADVVYRFKGEDQRA